MEKEFKEDLTVEEMKYDKNGLDLKLGGATAMAFMQGLVELFKVNGGKNFLTMTFNQGENKYGITIQNCNGVDTPAEKMQKQEDEINQLKEVYQDREDDIEFYLKVLREIDTHIRADKDPVPHIIETLKSSLPEYMDLNN